MWLALAESKRTAGTLSPGSLRAKLRAHEMSDSEDDMFSLLGDGAGLAGAMGAQDEIDTALRALESVVIRLAPLPAPEIEASKELAPRASDLAVMLLEGRYAEMLQLPIATRLLSAGDSEQMEASSVVARVAELLEEVDEDDDAAVMEAQLSVVWTAVACLLMFARSNWVGPKLDGADLPTWSFQWSAGAAKLEADSEAIHPCAELPGLLLAAQTLLQDCGPLLTVVELSVCWWGARALSMQQRCLDGAAGTIYDKQLELRKKANQLVLDGSDDQDRSVLLARGHIELALEYSAFQQDKQARAELSAAKECLGVELDTKGVPKHRPTNALC